MQTSTRLSGKTSMTDTVTTADRVYEFIVDYTSTHLYPPSIREISNGTDLSSTSTVAQYLKKLEQDGKITMKHDGVKNRAITLVGYSLMKNDGTTNRRENGVFPC